MTLDLSVKTCETDPEGYLLNLADWSPEVADHLARQDQLTLTDSHWEIINFLRDYYNEFQMARAVRPMTKAVAKKFGENKGNSQYLHDLFPYGPAKQGCRIAGLPKPTGCL